MQSTGRWEPETTLLVKIIAFALLISSMGQGQASLEKGNFLNQ
jgi:hypothetical protein